MKERIGGNWWIQNLLRPVLIAAMMVCLAAPVVQGMEWLLEGWDGTYFLVFAFFGGLEGILSERVLRKRCITGWGYPASRGAEALLLLLLLKFISYIPLGLDQLWADVLIWPVAPDRFLTDIDLTTDLLFLLLWAGALYVSRQATELDVDGSGVSPPSDKTSTEYYLWMTQPPPVRDRERTLNWLGETFVWGGVMILLASTVVFVLIPTTPVPAVPTLLYFALGVALLSQARFSVTHVGWQLRGIAIQRGIARRWLLWAVVFLVGVALVALLLPTEYAMGPVLALYRLIIILVQVMMLIVTLLFYLLVLLLSFLLPSVDMPTQPPLKIPSIAASEPAAAAVSSPWLEVLLSALFWAVILVIVGYASFRFLQDRFGPLATGEAAAETWWDRFLAWLLALWQRWRTWRSGVQARLARRQAERKGEGLIATRLSRFFSLARLSPCELVYYFYLSTARRAAQAGQPRGRGQTPYEYQATLDARFPDLEPDLMGLTDAFVQARYNPKPVRKRDAEAVKPLWQRIKAALRRRVRL